MFKSKSENEKRFKLKLKEYVEGGGIIKIIVDKETGVNYLIPAEMALTGATPMYNADGSLLIDEDIED